MIYVADTHVWEFDNGQTVAPNIIAMSIGDNLLLAMDFGFPIGDDDSIDSITSTAVADIAAHTEPTISESAVHQNKRWIVLTIATTLASAGTYTLTVKVVTVDGQTYVRSGRLVLA